jgi:hypothetical protein
VRESIEEAVSEVVNALKRLDEVYALYGYRGLDTFTMPPADRPLAHRVGYHLRTGQHDVTAWDWAQYIPFVKREVCANGK